MSLVCLDFYLHLFVSREGHPLCCRPLFLLGGGGGGGQAAICKIFHPKWFAGWKMLSIMCKSVVSVRKVRTLC